MTIDIYSYPINLHHSCRYIFHTFGVGYDWTYRTSKTDPFLVHSHGGFSSYVTFLGRRYILRPCKSLAAIFYMLVYKPLWFKYIGGYQGFSSIQKEWHFFQWWQQLPGKMLAMSAFKKGTTNHAGYHWYNNPNAHKNNETNASAKVESNPTWGVVKPKQKKYKKYPTPRKTWREKNSAFVNLFVYGNLIYKIKTNE